MAGDLITLAEAKAWLDITDASKDALLRRLITSASEAIARFVGYDPVSGERNETLDGNGKSKILIGNPPITAVSSLTVNLSAIPASSGPTSPGYFIEGKGIRLRGGYVFPRGEANVEVAYTGGYDEIPADMKQAALVTVQSMYQGKSVDPNITGESVPGAYSAQYAREGAGIVPAAAKTLLQPLARNFVP